MTTHNDILNETPATASPCSPEDGLSPGQDETRPPEDLGNHGEDTAELLHAENTESVSAGQMPNGAGDSLGSPASVTDTAAPSAAPEAGSAATAAPVIFADLDVPGADESDDVAPVVVVSTPDHVAAARDFFQRAKAAETEEQKKRARQQSCVLSLMQYRCHPETDEPMFAQELVDDGLDKLRDRLHRWAYIWHDRDRLVEVDPETEDLICCGIKGLHCHLVLWFPVDKRPTVRTVSDAFSVPSARVRLPNEVAAQQGVENHKGKSAAEKTFFDLAEYLPHETRGKTGLQGVRQPERYYLVDMEQPGQPGKYQYGRGRVVANFDFGRELDLHMAGRPTASAADGGRSLTLRKRRLRRLAIEGTSFEECKALDLDAALDDMPRLKQIVAEYQKRAPLPMVRMNHYIGGASRLGKTFLAQMMGEQMFPDLHPDDAVFITGEKGVALQHYEGQPVIIWDDFRPWDLLDELGGRTGVWRAFNPRPQRFAKNIKHSAASLNNAVNIVTGIMQFEEFLDQLAGEYTSKKTGETYHAEDANQSWGRFPFTHTVYEAEVQMYLNRGFFGDSPSYRDFLDFASIEANMRKVGAVFDACQTEEQRAQVRAGFGRRVFAPMIEARARALPQGSLTVDEAMAELDSLVTVYAGDDLVARRHESALAEHEQRLWDEFEEALEFGDPETQQRIEMVLLEERLSAVQRAAQMQHPRPSVAPHTALDGGTQDPCATRIPASA